MTDTAQPSRHALGATEIEAALAGLHGWQLHGAGPDLAIEKTWHFANFHDTMAFVNAVAFIAHRRDHHPDLSVHYNRCTVRYTTHDVQGLSALDFACAAQVDALQA